MAASKLSTNAHLLETAQSNRISFGDGFVSARMTQLIGAHADAIGVPLEFIFWPLLTAVGSFIGTNGHIRINSEWVEPSIMWFVIAAKKGEKKTAALRRIRKPVKEIERDLIGEWGSAQRSNDDKSVPPQLIVDHFSFEELHSIMSQNNGQILGCFDEMSTLYGQLDLYKHASTMDRKTLLTLNGGGAWARNFKSYTGRISKTAFNITGFIQPAFVFEMLNSDDADGLNDRQLFDFPPERELLLNELVVPMPADTPDLKSILNAVRLAHVSAEMYTLEGEAYELFRMCHDELVQEKQKTKDENVQGILSKARGYLARIALIVHCLEQAIVNTDREDDECPPWSTNVSPKAVEAAIRIIKHFNTQKFIALGFGDGDVTSPTKTAFVNNRVARLLSICTQNMVTEFSTSRMYAKNIFRRKLVPAILCPRQQS